MPVGWDDPRRPAHGHVVDAGKPGFRRRLISGRRRASLWSGCDGWVRSRRGSVRISVCEAWSVSPTIGRETVSDGRSRRQGRDAPDCSLVRSRCLFLRPDLPSSWRPRPAVSNPPSSAGPEPRAATAWERAWRGPTICHGRARPSRWTQVAMAARSVTAVTKRGPHSRDAVQVEIDDLLKRLRCGTGAQTFR